MTRAPAISFSGAPSSRWLFLRPRRNVLPGFGIAMGYTLLYLSLIVLIPLAGLLIKAGQLSSGEFWATISSPQVVAAYRVSLGAAALAAVINGTFGLLVAWVMVRYTFPLRRFFDALIDVPFALPTAVAGLTFADLYSSAGFNYATSNAGIVVVLTFVGLPFVVRTVQPVLQELSSDYEEAARSLGASRFYTFRRVIFPQLLPAWLAGLALAFARAIGEYGSVIFIAGNIPGQSQIAPMQIVTKLDDFRYAEATAIAVVLLAISLTILLAINGIEWWTRRRM
jgi:sulfate/thiosulfate transport system permease protein